MTDSRQHLKFFLFILAILPAFFPFVCKAEDQADESREYFTVQVASFPSLNTASPLYDHLAQQLPEDTKNFLRIEKVGRFYTVRVARTDSMAEAEKILAQAKQVKPEAVIMRAFVKKERIQRMAGVSETASATPPEPKQPLEAEAKAAAPPAPEAKPVAAATPAPNKPDEKPVAAAAPAKGKPDEKPVAAAPDASAGKPREFHTLQIVSSPSLESAQRAWDGILAKIPANDRDHLRIEKIGNAHAIRVGKFENRESAAILAAKLRNAGLSTLVISAWIKEERIEKIWRPEDEAKTAETAAKPAAASQPAPKTPPTQPQTPAPTAEKPSAAPAAAPSPAPAAQTPPPAAAPTPPPAAPAAKGKTPAAPEPAASEGKGKPAGKEPAAAPETKPALGEAEPLGEPEEKAEPEKKEKEKVKVDFLAEMNNDSEGNPTVFPSHVFTDPKNEEIYVVNGGKNKIVVYDRNFFPVSAFGKGRDIDKAEGGMISEDGRLFICQRSSTTSKARLTILSPAFMVLNEIILSSMEGAEKFLPLQAAIGKNKNIYIAGNYGNGVLVLNEKGEYSHWLGVFDEKYDKMYKKTNPNGGKPVPIRDIKIDAAGNIFLLSEETSRIYVYSPDEKQLFAFGSKGGSNGKMSRPKTLAIDEEKNCIYVVDYMRHTILIFDLNGVFRYEFGGQGWGPGWFNFPSAITLDRKGNLLVADFFNNRVQVINASPPSPLPERDKAVWQ